MTFTTPKIPLSVAIVAVPNPVTYGSSYTVEGTLSGTGGGNRQVTLQYTPFPYTAPFCPIRQRAHHQASRAGSCSRRWRPPRTRS